MSDSDNQPDRPWVPRRRSWARRFGDAFRGIAQGAQGQSSFAVHVVAAIAVLVLAAYLQLSVERWCLLILCIGSVLSAELFNSSLERLSRSITGKHDPNIERALNIASGAVLTVACTAGIIGLILFITELRLL